MNVSVRFNKTLHSAVAKQMCCNFWPTNHLT